MQDAYSLRCAAQVHGAAREALRFVRDTLTIEANAATDNPMVFADDGRNRLGRQLPRRAGGDRRRSAGDRAGAARDDQRAALGSARQSGAQRAAGVPDADSGLQSGYMMAQVTAAALVSEIKTLAHPASVDTIPTSANREDHVSMSMGAALKAERALDARDARPRDRDPAARARRSICSRRSTTSPPLQRVHARVRSVVPTLADDRPPSPDIEAIAAMIDDGSLESLVRA